MKAYTPITVTVLMLFVVGTLAAENRFFYPDGMQGLPGEDLTIQLMLETDVQLQGYGFSTGIDTTAFEFTLPDDSAFTWDGTAAESGNLPIRTAGYDPLTGAFGGFAAAITCAPGVAPGEHVALNIHIHIRDDALPGTYTFQVPYPPNPGAMTDCDGVDVPVNEYHGQFEILAVIDLDAPDSISLDEGDTYSVSVTVTDEDPSAEVCVWATQLPGNASFDSTCATGSVTSTFFFSPDYCQAGSYEVVFHGRDEYGRQVEKHVPIVVANVNRAPIMFGGPNQTVVPGDTLSFAVKARDRDYLECGDDSTTITAVDVPTGASFSQDSDSTGLFYWPTTEDDTGTYTVAFTAEDLFGLSSTDEVQIDVTEFADTLLIADVAGCAGYNLEVPVYSFNYGPLYDYRVFIEFDHQLLDVVYVDTVSTASAGAPIFVYEVDPIIGFDGLFIGCAMDSTEPIPSGRNLLASVVFHISEDAEVFDSTILHLPEPGPGWPIETPNTWPYLLDGTIYFSDCFIRADADCDGIMRMADVVYTLRALYVPESDPLYCKDAADSNDDGAVQMSDGVYTLRALYVPDSPDPPPPFPGCGADPTMDELDCQYHPCWRWPPEGHLSENLVPARDGP